MRKEARYNLIFIVVLLVLCVPGVIMLVKKKLQQEGDVRGGMSAPVPTHVVYVDPLPMGSNIREIVVPPQTHAWARGLAGRSPDPDHVHISRNRSFEIVDRRAEGDGIRLAVLLWDPRLAPDRGVLQASVEHDGERINGRVDPVQPLRLPDEIRGELRRSGYSAAPRSIHWTEVHLPGTAEAGWLTLTVTQEGSSHADRIDLESIQF